MALEFEADAHVYSVGGRVLTSVTQALVLAGVTDTYWYTETARDRGSRVHKAIQYDLEGDLDEDSVDFNEKGYLDACRRFCKEHNFVPTACEVAVADEARGFAGTLDCYGEMKRRVTIVDWKTGLPTRATELQLTGYAIGLKVTHGVTATKLLAVQLMADGRYKEHPFRFQPKAFLGALEVAKWRGSN